MDDYDNLHRLRSAVVELSTALQRAQAMLDDVESDAPATPLEQTAEKVVRQGLAPWQLRRVLAHIEANLSAPMRNGDLAAIARLSTFHFAVAFRASVGESPHEHIIRRRVERAQGLMLSTNRSLSDIAGECGLADQAHLTRLFRRIVGESPAAWRRARVP